jgi:FkbM family methyltransferase
MFFIKDLVHYLYLVFFKLKYKKTKIFCEYFSDVVPGFYSQKGQDVIIYSEFFSLINNANFPRVIVDIGCNHPILYSNSYFFEKNLGFKCIAVDPLKNYKSLWTKERPKAKFYNFALGSSKSAVNLLIKSVRSGKGRRDYLSEMFSTFSKVVTQSRSGNWISKKVQVFPAQDLFDSLKLSEIGIISIDVEGFETEVIKGIVFSKTKIHIAIIENNINSMYGSDEVRNIMHKNGFNFYGRIWCLDDIFINRKTIKAL